MIARKQSTTNYPIQFLMVDSINHVIAKTGLTPTVTISKNGGAYGAASGAVTEVGNGVYSLAGNATDRETLGELMIHASASGADPVDMKVLIVSYDPFTDIASILADTGTDGVKLASGSITAAVIATDAIDADAIKADAITEIQAGLALEATLTAIKGAGWTNETLKKIVADIAAISAGGGATAAEVWAYALRTLTGFTTTEFHVIGPVRNDGKIDALAGDDYYAADGRGMVWSDTAWPDLTGATVNFISGSTTIAMSVVTAGTGEQTVNLDVPKATSLAMKGEFKFIIQATLTNGHVATLLEGEGTFK